MIKSFESFKFNTQIEEACVLLGINNFEISQEYVDGKLLDLVNAYSGVSIVGRQLNRIPVKFGKVIGGFWCQINKLTSLIGSPQIVHGHFNCEQNKLIDLDGSPQRVIGNFNCAYNNIYSFKGIPEYSLDDVIDFDCYGNPVSEIYDLFGTPKCVDLINEFNVIVGDLIIKDRLEEINKDLKITN